MHSGSCFVQYSDWELKLHSDIRASALTDCLWAIIDASYFSRRRHPLNWRINFDQFPRLTINKLFTLLGWLKGVSDFSSSSGAYSTAIYFIMQVKASKTCNWDSRGRKKPCHRQIAVTHSPGLNIALVNVWTKQRLCAMPLTMKFLFLVNRFTWHFKTRKLTKTIPEHFCKQGQIETEI